MIAAARAAAPTRTKEPVLALASPLNVAIGVAVAAAGVQFAHEVPLGPEEACTGVLVWVATVDWTE